MKALRVALALAATSRNARIDSSMLDRCTHPPSPAVSSEGLDLELKIAAKICALLLTQNLLCLAEKVSALVGLLHQVLGKQNGL